MPKEHFVTIQEIGLRARDKVDHITLITNGPLNGTRAATAIDLAGAKKLVTDLMEAIVKMVQP